MAWGLMCIYGIEKLADNAAECRANMVEVFNEFIGADTDAGLCRRAAVAVTAANIVCGDALAMTEASGRPIVFVEWGRLGRGRFVRQDFTFESLLVDRGGIAPEPVSTFLPFTVAELAAGSLRVFEVEGAA